MVDRFDADHRGECVADLPNFGRTQAGWPGGRWCRQLHLEPLEAGETLREWVDMLDMMDMK